MALVAADIMNRDVVCVPSGMDLRDLAKLFLTRRITGAPVVDADGNLEGVISQTDLLYYSLTRDDELVMDSHFYDAVRVEGRRLPKGFQIEDVNSGSVADVMTPVVHSVTERASLQSITRMMMRKHIHRVIVRRGRKVAGIISALDILKSVLRPERAHATARPTARGRRASRRAAARP
jgi:CBS domain-containing protein